MRRGSRRMIAALAVCVCSSALLPAVHAQAGKSAALVRYYVGLAREAFHKLDISRSGKTFAVSAVVRKFTLNSEADTLRLDTAIIRAYFTSDAGIAPDTLKPDSQLILRSSFLEDKPAIPALFARPAWEGKFQYSLFPNDPGRGEIAIAFNSPAETGGFSRWGSNGLLTLDRSTGELRYVALFIRSPDGISRYSRETTYTLISGYLAPKRIVEHISKVSFWGNQYEIRETRLLKVAFTDLN